MSDRSVDRVQRALERRRDALEAELAKRPQGPTADEAEELERLHRLIALRRREKPPRGWRDRLPALVAVALSLALLTFLFFVRRNQVEVELFVTVVEAEFVSARSQTLFAPTRLSALQVVTADLISIPRARGVAAVALEGGPLSIEVPATEASDEAGEPSARGSIDLEPVVLEEGSRVRIEPGGDGAVQLLLGGRPTEMGAALAGELTLAGPGVGRQFETREECREGACTLDFGVGRRLAIGGEALAVRVEGAGAGPAQSFGEHLAVSALSLSRVYRLEGEQETIARRISTVIDGRLIFEELAGTEIELRPGDRVLLDVVDGWLRQVSVEEGTVALAFNGTLRDLSLGYTERKRSLMPTQFEWVRAQHSWMLLWGSALSLIGVVLSFMRWLGFEP